MIKSFVEKEFRAIGTDIYIQLILKDSKLKLQAKKDIADVESIYREKEKLFSRFDSRSELSKLNNSLNRYIKSSQDILYLAEKILFYYKESERIFDPRTIEVLEDIGYKKNFKENIFEKTQLKDFDYLFKRDLFEDLKIKEDKIFFGKRMDFSGLAKGYITDEVVYFLEKKGWRNFLINSGGDLFAKGFNKQEEKWKVAIENNPNSRADVIIEVSDEAVATSGVTRKKWKIAKKRFHHLINPRNLSKFDFELKSVSVIEKSTERADALAKVLFLMGTKKGIEFSNKRNIKSVFLLKDNSLIFSKYFKKQ